MLKMQGRLCSCFTHKIQPCAICAFGFLKDAKLPPRSRVNRDIGGDCKLRDYFYTIKDNKNSFFCINRDIRVDIFVV